MCVHQWAWESTSTNFHDDFTVILETPKFAFFPNFWKKLNILLFVIYSLVK